MAVYLMLNKPRGCITARHDETTPTVMDYLPAEYRTTLHPMGRLDKDTEGLLLLTDNGQLTYRLMSPAHHVEKQYFFFAFGLLDEDKCHRLENGVPINRNGAVSRPARAQALYTTTVGEVIDCLDPEKREQYLKNPRGCVTAGYIWLTEGRFHEVKRMLKTVGCTVGYLKRVAVGGVQLDDRLKPGDYRELTEEEITCLTQQNG